VRFNAIAPGVTITDSFKNSDHDTPEMHQMVINHTPLRRLGLPEDIANLAPYLGSDAASWVTGQVIDASGGWNLPP
jgi:NAD(P)-dependent dehydrogenase (short-subunit alcohol dehydrogenase family)